MRKYKHLFFDLDHTLWDFETNAKLSLEELYQGFELKTKGIPSLEDFYTSYFKHNAILWNRYRKGFINRKELGFKRMWRVLLDYKIPDTDLSLAMNEKYLEVLPLKEQLMPEAKSVLEDLKNKGYPLHIITNGYKTGQIKKMRSSRIDAYFQTIVTSESAGKPKPHPEIFRHALEKVKAVPEETLMIGDALEVDVLGAQKMGMGTVFFNPEKSPLKGIEPTYDIGQLSQLKDFL